jgi:hypothetical protein
MGLVRDLCCVHELSRLLGFRLRSSKAAPFFKARGNNARLRRGRQAFGLDDFEPFRDWYFKVGKCSPKSCSSCSLSGRLTIKLVRGRGFVAFPGLETEILRLRSGQALGHPISCRSKLREKQIPFDKLRAGFHSAYPHRTGVRSEPQGHPKDEDLSLGTPTGALR